MAQYSKRTKWKKKDRVIIATDVNERDGIGNEVYRNDKLVVENFRDDTDKTRTITVFMENVSLELIEECISTFKKVIPGDFIDYSEIEHEKINREIESYLFTGENGEFRAIPFY